MGNTLTVEQAAQALGKDKGTIRYLIDKRLVPWGMSFRYKDNKRKNYIIYADKFAQETGIRIAD